MPGEPVTTSVKTRFAPSPSGDLHLGNARTALFSYLLARRQGGVFLLRIEDTDSGRSSEASCAGIIENLRWLGLHWDEGPDRDGGNGPYRQSERGAVYEQMYQRLTGKGLTYPCFCTAETLAVQRKTQLAAGRPPRYAGTCASLSEGQAGAKLEAGMRPTLRFRVPRGAGVQFDDLVKGVQRFSTDDIGDFIIRRADGSAAFFFCNAVDDALMGVTHVLRGDDHLSNTPRQLLLLEALGVRPPQYAHVSLILGADGAPLSKRHGSASVEELRERGYLPGAVLNGLARLGHHYEAAQYMSLDELAAGFETGRLGTAPSHFDAKQLGHWQREAVLHADTDTLASWLDEETRARVPQACLEQFIHGVSGNILFPSDAGEWAGILYGESTFKSDDAEAILRAADKSLFRQAQEALALAGADYLEFIHKLESMTPLRGKKLLQPLRAVLTGRLDGPSLVALFNLMGVDRIHQRLEQALC